MKIRRFSKLNESSQKLTYACYDWDDNILHMPTMIHMDKNVNGDWVPEDVSTSKFAEIRKDENWRIKNNNPDEAFSEFRDFGPRGDTAFLEDTKKAISSGDLGPSWDAFIKTLYNGSIFAIITARGHEPKSIKKAVEYIIDNILTEDEKFHMYSNCLKFSYLFGTDYDSYDRIPKGNISSSKLISDYLDQCYYFGVSSTYCIKLFKMESTPSDVEKGKEEAIKFFTNKIHNFGNKLGKKVSMGFSDDDIRNVNHIEKLFTNELSLTHAMEFNIFNTSDRSIKSGVRKKIFQEGLDSSVIPFTKWNNMTQKLYPSGDSRQDDFQNQFRNNLGQLKDITKDINIKKKIERKR